MKALWKGKAKTAPVREKVGQNFDEYLEETDLGSQSTEVTSVTNVPPSFKEKHPNIAKTGNRVISEAARLICIVLGTILFCVTCVLYTGGGIVKKEP